MKRAGMLKQYSALVAADSAVEAHTVSLKPCSRGQSCSFPL